MYAFYKHKIVQVMFELKIIWTHIAPGGGGTGQIPLRCDIVKAGSVSFE